MMRQGRDEHIRRAFEEIREEDRGDLPSFERLLAEARSAGETGAVEPRWRGAARVAAGLVSIALLVLLVVARREPTARSEPDVTSIAAWRSPTAALLRTPGRELAAEMPRLGGFGVDAFGGIGARPTSEPARPLIDRKEIDP